MKNILQMEPLNFRRRSLVVAMFLNPIILEFCESESHYGKLQAADCVFICYAFDLFRICIHLLYIHVTAVYASFLVL